MGPENFAPVFKVYIDEELRCRIIKDILREVQDLPVLLSFIMGLEHPSMTPQKNLDGKLDSFLMLYVANKLLLESPITTLLQANDFRPNG